MAGSDWDFLNGDEPQTAPKAKAPSMWEQFKDQFLGSGPQARSGAVEGAGDLAELALTLGSNSLGGVVPPGVRQGLKDALLDKTGLIAPPPKNTTERYVRGGARGAVQGLGPGVELGVGRGIAAGLASGLGGEGGGDLVEAAAPEKYKEPARQLGAAIGSVVGGGAGWIGAPVAGKVISGFGHRMSPKAGASSNHMGVDLRAPVGSPFQASADGIVTNRGSGGKRGNWIEVDYGNGVTSRYFHLQDSRVKPGQEFSAGDVLGRTGRTGNVTGPHLHWTVMKDGTPVDPMKFNFEGHSSNHGAAPDEASVVQAENDAAAKTQGFGINRSEPVPENVQEFAFQKAIADHAAEHNLDHVKLGSDYLNSPETHPELVRAIDERMADNLRGLEALPGAPKNQEAEFDPEMHTAQGQDGTLDFGPEKGIQPVNIWSPEGLQKRIESEMGGAVPTLENPNILQTKGLQTAANEGGNVHDMAPHRKFATPDDEIDYLDEVIAQGGPGADAAAVRQDELMAQQSAEKHAAQEAGKRGGAPKAANDASRRMTAEELTNDPKHQAAIKAEDAYNEFVGWGEGPGVPVPARRQRNAHKAWQAKHDELWEAKQAAYKAATGPVLDKSKLLSTKGLQTAPGGGEKHVDPENTTDYSNYDENHPVVKLVNALKEAIPIRKKQEQGYSRARGRKLSDLAEVRQHTSGEEGFYQELGALKGELPKQDFSSVRDQFSQEDVNHLFNMAKNSKRLGLYDSVTVRKALLKMMEGRVPNKSELELMGRVFPKNMIDELTKGRPFMQKFTDAAANTLNIPRALMASFDASAPLRQGVFLAGRKEFYTNWANMYKHFGPQTHRDIIDGIIARPTYNQMRKAGLALTDTDTAFLTNREEDYMSSWSEKIPVVGHGVKASNRLYSGFLNTLRADTFDSILKHWDDVGFDYKDDPKTLKDLGKYINTATGRGSLGQFNQAVPFLNTMLFSPRLIASRVQLMNPLFYARLDPMVRKQALRDLFSFGGLANTILGLTSAATAAGILGKSASVGDDPRSADFGKIKVGNTRFEITGGFQPYIRLAAQLASGKVVSSTSGKITDLNTGKFGMPTKADKVGEFLASKESPVLSFIHEQFGRGGKNAVGEDVSLTKALTDRITPLMIGGVVDAYKDLGPGSLAAVPFVASGVGEQTYTGKVKKEKKTKASGDWDFVDQPAPNAKKEKATNDWDFVND